MYENPFYEPYWVNEEELEHYGIKGMKWGVRRTPEQLGHRRQLSRDIRQDRDKLRSELKKKYKVDEAYAQADTKYNAAYKKLGYDPPDGEKYYKHAEDLAKKVSDELDKTLTEKYGKDYKKVVKSDERLGAIVVTSGLALSVLGLYGGTKLAGMAGSAALKAGEKAIRRVIGG